MIRLGLIWGRAVRLAASMPAGSGGSTGELDPLASRVVASRDPIDVGSRARSSQDQIRFGLRNNDESEIAKILLRLCEVRALEMHVQEIIRLDMAA